MTAQALPYGDHSAPRTSDSTALEGRPRVLPLLLFVTLAVALFFAMIYLRISLDQSAFEIDGLQREIAVEQSLQLDLRYKVAALQDPLRIATEAERMGLVYPAERVAVVVERFGSGAQVLVQEVPVRALPGDGP